MSRSQYRSLSVDSIEDRCDSSEQSRPFIGSPEKNILPLLPSSLWHYRRWVLATVLVVLSLSLIVSFGPRVFTSSFSSSPRWTHCGSTVKEAHARDCQYDVMIGSWLLPECSDIGLMEEYLAERDWEFYRDQNLTEVIPMDVLRRGEHTYPVWASVHQHQHHCAYMWMKQFRAAVARKKMDDLSASVDHTRHCADGLYTGMPGAKENLALAVKYFSCVDAGDGNPRRDNNPNNEIVPVSHHHDERGRF